MDKEKKAGNGNGTGKLQDRDAWPSRFRTLARDHAVKNAYEHFLENVERDDVPQFSFLNPGDIGGSMTDQCFEEVQNVLIL